MPALSPSGELETNRLVLRTRRVDEAAIYRQLWTERDPRVPAHRRVDPEGRPTIRDVAGWIRTENDGPGSGLLAVVRKVEGDVIGYCGLTFDRDARAGEAGLAYELLQRVHGLGYATEAAQAIVTWAAQVGYERLWATVRAWNSASRRVLEKLAFVETGQIEHDSVHGDSLLTVKELGSLADRQRVLADLPSAQADRESVIEAHVACASVFLPLARDLHDRCGVGWPQEFEDATRRHLSKALSIELPRSHRGHGDRCP